MKFYKLFKKNKKPILIGAVHFPPLAPYSNTPGRLICLKKALDDIDIFQQGRIDAIILENNYDLPHTKYIKKQTYNDLNWLIKKIKPKVKIPIGLSLLWNDFPNALKLSAKYRLNFIRIPVFVDHIQTHYGFKIKGNSKKVLEYQNKFKANNTLLLTDIHVKHSKILNKENIIQSADNTIKKQSDALIITGKWTGKKPNLNELKRIRKNINDFPMIIGSGLDHKNAKSIFKYADGAIVATSLKAGKAKKNEINVKPWQDKISLNKVKKLIKTVE